MIEVTVILICVLLITIITFFGVKREHYRKKYQVFYSLPTPSPTLPLIGNCFLFYKFDYNLLKVFNLISEQVGNPCAINLPSRHYFTSCPEELKIILNHPDALEKSTLYDVFKIVFGKALLLESVPQWKKNRKLLSKGFNQKVLDGFVDTFYKISCNLNTKLQNNNSDLVYTFQKNSWDNFNENLFENTTNSLDEETNEFIDMITNGQHTMTHRVGNLIKMNDFLYKFTKDGKYLEGIMTRAKDFLQTIIVKYKKKSERDDQTNIEENTDLMKLPLLKLILAKTDDEYIKKELILFAAAATDTTAYSMAYTCILLAMHPAIQEKVYKEVINIVGKDEEITYNILPSLKYTEMAINEALRLLPVVPWIARKSTADIDLGTKVIPPNTDIHCFIFGTHRNEKFYPDPKKYDPDRFLPEEVAKRPQFAFLPFSRGPRNCLGWKYGMMAMKTTIANIVRNFHISTKYKSIDDMEFVSSIVMSPTHPLDCQFKIRK
ncbi:unnamed protein product [Brassicogethes aeneus]|uniref:Cytochrome P450 n=1 Tax=Brassicogethes aeneus TaxID=1431903 RepID=A0A9P0BC79_BRAAE|nr:unnamed protein product [Brassicogethes aeneus]